MPSASDELLLRVIRYVVEHGRAESPAGLHFRSVGRRPACGISRAEGLQILDAVEYNEGDGDWTSSSVTRQAGVGTIVTCACAEQVTSEWWLYESVAQILGSLAESLVVSFVSEPQMGGGEPIGAEEGSGGMPSHRASDAPGRRSGSSAGSGRTGKGKRP